ncbi:MAG: LysM peptidoglycan-binding domain-containing protein [Patescibacteria group bacterium]
MKNSLSKIKILLILINFLKKAVFSVFWFLEKIAKLLINFLFIIVKIFAFLIAPFYFKIKKSIKEFLSNFHYQKELFSLFIQKGIIFISLFLIVIFIFFEEKTTFEEKFFAQALAVEEKGSKNISFEIASETEEAIPKPSLTFEKEFIPTRTEIEKYIVKPGDTISSIAKDFDVSINTILWENKLTINSIIKPGQILKILPVSGVSHKVKQGDTIEKIAQLYRANIEDIIRFNNLEEEPLKVGDVIIIPEGKIPPPPPRPRIYKSQDKIWLTKEEGKRRQGTNCRDFYPGQCTWYVAQRYCITFSGHAKSWLANAARAGYKIGNTPQVGAIISLKETWYGHVGIVEEVKENTIVISEMNHLGPWIVNKRELNINDWRINGYIYPF